MRLFSLILAICLPFQGQSSNPDLGSATVEVKVFDTFGIPLEGAQVTLTAIGPALSFKETGATADFKRVPFGRYDLEVKLVGFETRRQEVRVYGPSLIFRAGLELGSTSSVEHAELSGLVRSVDPRNSDLWVRLAGIYSSDLIENAVSEKGQFEFVGIAPGKYVLLLLQKDKILAVRQVEILRRKTLVEVTPDSR
jgi:hypothetical protein